MNLRHTLLLILTLCSFETLYSQTSKEYKSTKSYQMVDSLFNLGGEGYSKMFKSLIKSPIETFRSGNEGLLIVQIKMSSEGQVSAKFMTKIDKHLESQFKDYLNSSIQLWNSFGESYEVYQVLAIGTEHFKVPNLLGNVNGFPKELKPPFAPMITFNYRRSIGRPIRVQVDREGGETRSLEQIAQAEIDKQKSEGRMSKPKVVSEETTLAHYHDLESRLNKQLEKGNAKKAHKVLTELIRFNPFDINLLTKRYDLENSLGINEYQSYDVPWIVALRKMKAQKLIE